MKYEIVRSENEKKLLEDIEERLDETLWCMDGCKQIMFVPIGLITKNGKDRTYFTHRYEFIAIVL